MWHYAWIPIQTTDPIVIKAEHKKHYNEVSRAFGHKTIPHMIWIWIWKKTKKQKQKTKKKKKNRKQNLGHQSQPGLGPGY